MPDDLNTTLLASYPLVLVMPDHHPLTTRSRLTIDDLAGLALVLPPPHRPHRIAVERALRAANVDWTLAIEAEGWPLMLHFVSLGVGMAVVNGCVRLPSGLTSREITGLPSVPYYAAQLPGHEDPRVGNILTAIRIHLSR